ncbi:MAG: sialate O-acetylesterase [Opitutae bacterium]|nr:sialate O-acetylesterase [Opitutae bacterium]
MLRSIRFLALTLAAGALPPAGLRADVTLAPLFTDGAILQQGKPVPVWGRADAGEHVSVTFAGQTIGTTTPADGRWVVVLAPLAASAAGTDLVAQGKNTVAARNVLVGEVWLCSGQSNMAWTVARSQNAAKEIAAANFPLLRVVTIGRKVSASPEESANTGAGWQAATPQTAGAFTGVGYFFARDIHQKLGVPVGIISAAYGGTPIESWLSATTLAQTPAAAYGNARWQKNLATYPAQKLAFDTALATWQKLEAAAKAAGAGPLAAFHKQNPKPVEPYGPGHFWQPAGCFNAMIHPLLPFALRGVLWYQGENNALRRYDYPAADYYELFPALITSWRAYFGQGDLPFYWVQLANFKNEEDWPILREAQTRALTLPNTGMAVAIDIGNPADIHPTNKQEVGRRLALIAKAQLYHVSCDWSGPLFQSATREGAAMRVRFTHAESNLIAHDKPVQSLEIAGADRKFYPAQGRIVGSTLLVSSPAVPAPVAVRYAWKSAPEANLFNGAGLPASPFRSDNW